MKRREYESELRRQDIVLSLINGEATVKRFRLEADFVVLTPNRPTPAMKRCLSREFSIQGKVITKLPDNIDYD
jgi:SOS-response transcriptional repressor LexA